jgi:hypothetical protein
LTGHWEQTRYRRRVYRWILGFCLKSFQIVNFRLIQAGAAALDEEIVKLQTLPPAAILISEAPFTALGMPSVSTRGNLLQVDSDKFGRIPAVP